MLSKICIAFGIIAVVMAKGGSGRGGQGGQGGRDGPSGHGGPGGPGRHGGPPPPPFLHNVTDDARKAFFDIVKNENLTQSQIDSQTAAWANTYGVSEIYTEFQQNKTALEAALKSNVSSVINNLSSVNDQLNTIFSNKDQTRDQVKTAVDAVRQNYPIEVDTIMFLTYPRHGGPGGPGGPEGPGGPGGRGGRGGRGGFGGDNSTTATTKTNKKANKKNASSR